MAGNKKLPGASKRVRHDLIFGSPILAHENLQAYELLVDRLYSENKPKDFIEESYLHNVAYWLWELWRWRRMKTCVVEAAVPAAMVWVLAVPRRQRLEHIGDKEVNIAEIIDPPMSQEEKTELEELAANTKRELEEEKKRQDEMERMEEAKRRAADFKLTVDTITTRAFLEKLDTVERIDRMIIAAENRLNLAYREMDRYRRGLGSAWREKI